MIADTFCKHEPGYEPGLADVYEIQWAMSSAGTDLALFRTL